MALELLSPLGRHLTSIMRPTTRMATVWQSRTTKDEVEVEERRYKDGVAYQVHQLLLGPFHTLIRVAPASFPFVLSFLRPQFDT